MGLFLFSFRIFLRSMKTSVVSSSLKSDVFVCLIWFFTSTQQSCSYAGRFFLGLTSTKLG